MFRHALTARARCTYIFRNLSKVLFCSYIYIYIYILIKIPSYSSSISHVHSARIVSAHRKVFKGV